MVSLWPFKGDSNSAASFEKTLSQLSTKISKTSSQADALRRQARRLRVGWALYGGFAYILVFIILTIVTGWHNWGPIEYTIVAGGPPLLYVVRQVIVTFYDWRISSTQDYLDGLYKERDVTIEKLKKATKYDSTQQLLDKYGSPKPSAKSKNTAGGKQSSKDQKKPQEQRVFRQPPPTANIPRNQPATPQQMTPGMSMPGSQPPGSAQSQPGSLQRPMSPTDAGAEFAPNAFGDGHVQYAPGPAVPRWYDRIMDALLGEDETQARNRIALICKSCRLVNGQAPPGTRSLEEVGRWRCSACGAWNGEESETTKLVQHLVETGGVVPGSPSDVASPTSEVFSVDREEDEEEADELLDESFDDDAVEVSVDTPAKSTRSRTGGKKK